MNDTTKFSDKVFNLTTVKGLIQAMLDGVKIRASHWPAGEYIYFSKDKYLQEDGRERLDVIAVLQEGFAKRSEWTIVQEPKPKVKLYKWAYVAGGYKRRWEESMCYYKNEEDLNNGINNLKEFKRLDYTCIEVEND